MKKVSLMFYSTICATLLTSAYAAETITVPMYLVTTEGQGKSIGDIKIEQRKDGVLFIPQLHGLSPGKHGFHVHENPSCADSAKAAGGHFDPGHTGQHNGPYSKHGHQGDLPRLIVDQSGNATLPLLAPKFKLSDLKSRSIIIHAGGDNYADTPEKLGGGGARIACGVTGS